MFKNFFRLVKNPVGYIGWKIHRWVNPVPKLLTIGGFFTLVGFFWYWKNISLEYEELDKVLMNYGKNVEGTSGRMKGYHNRKQYHVALFPESVMRSHFTPDMVVLNPTWKQNIRK